MLNSIAKDLWEVRGDLFGPLGIHFPVRMTIIRLEDGGLVLISPVELDDTTADAIDEVGTVRYLVAPNCLHHLYLGAAMERWPDAEVWAPRGLSKKREDLNLPNTFGAESQPSWGADLQAFPLEGVPGAREWMFWHRPSGTLVVTDLVFNMKGARTFASRVMFTLVGTYGRCAQSRLLQFFTKDRQAAGASLIPVLQLPIQRVVMAHGDVLEDDARARLAHALRWMTSGQALVESRAA